MTLRTRLTLAYTGIVFVILIVVCAALFWDEPRVGLTLLDADLRRDALEVERLLVDASARDHDRAGAARDMLRMLKPSGRGVAVFDPNGALLGARWDGVEPLDPEYLQASRPGVPHTVRTPGGAGRLYRRVVGPAGEWDLVLVTSLDPVARDAIVLRRSLLFAVPLAVLAAALGGWFVLTRSLRPVELMSHEASQITAADLSRRLSVAASPGDLRGLATTFNALLDRLSAAIERQREFMADASHELRTPTSVARTAAEVTLSGDHRTEAEYREALTIVREQAGRMARLVDDMLLLARADMGQKPISPVELYLDDIVSESVRSLRVLAQPRNISIAVAGRSDLQVRADEALVRQMLVNLLENAVRYTAPGGAVRVDVSAGAGAAVIDVVDEGPGVPAAHRQRIFERFVKLDPSRLRDTGAGLGLPIARWIAEAHGGSLELVDTGESGSTFRATLPR